MHKYLGYIAVMAVVTYLVRMLPITLFQKEIKNIYIKSFLYYMKSKKFFTKKDAALSTTSFLNISL